MEIMTSRRRIGRRMLALSVVVLVCTAAFAQTRSGQKRGSTIQLSYGTVVAIEVVKPRNKAGKGAVVGGLSGLANASSRHAARDAAAGALVGALLTSALQKHKANQYTVRRTNGSMFEVVLDHHTHFRVGDCVAVEEGASTNLRVVHASLCEDQATQNHPMIQEHHQSEAQECHAAKEQLLKATDDDAFNRAMQAVKVLCH